MSQLNQPPFSSEEPVALDPAVVASVHVPPPARRVRPDIETPWDILDLFVFFIFALGMLYLLTNLLAGIAVARFGVPLMEIEHFSATNAGFVVLRQFIWFACLLIYLYALVRRRSAQPFWSTIGWRGLRLSSWTPAANAFLLLFCGAALGVAADIASLFYNTEKRLPIQDLFESPHGVAYLMVFGILIAPLAEETVFRGYVYPVLARKFGIVAGVGFTGILFGLVHVPQLRGGFGQIATLVCVGVALTAVRAASRSVFASYLVHLGYNTFLFSGFLLQLDAVRHLRS